MGSYTVPRQIDDENRFLVFSKKSLQFVLVGIVAGVILGTPFFILSAFASWFNYIAWGIITFFGVVAWALGTFKIPYSNAFDILKKAGGESVDVIANRIRKFRKNRKIYVYKGGNSK